MNKKIYFKILKEDLNHHGFQYHEGLNVDSNLFNSKPCYDGGFFFSSAENIFLFCHYGAKIALSQLLPTGVGSLKAPGQ